jgi:hypothetical protein
LPQLKKAKLSSRAKDWLQLLTAPVDEPRLVRSYSREDFDAADEALLSLTYPCRLLLLSEIANLRDEAAAAERFWKKWGETFMVEPKSKKALLEIRDQLREIWQAPTSGASEVIVKDWLNRREGEPGVLFKCSIKLSKFVPELWSLRAMLIQGILEHWEHFRLCANASCAAPYFVAKRRDQTICDAGDCKAEKQRQHALKWWRANRAKSPSKTKGRSERNVTRKTR